MGAELARELKEYARTIGVAKLGITTAESFVPLLDILRRRQADGRMSPFEVADPELRCDPAQWLPGARSLISAAVAYKVEAPFRPRPSSDRRQRGWISRHAWGRDYHDVVREKLDLIAAWISERVPRSASKVFVDTGAPVDRAVAERAGVGWIGRNCSLIVPGAGSWVALGTLVTTATLPADEPAAPPGTECGDCDICLRACPTGALVEPHVLDSKRCLSFVTQMSGTVPVELRPALGKLIYGCDTCQQVCPQNRDIAELGDPGFVPASPWETSPDLLGLLNLSKRQFEMLYGHKASGWRGRKVQQRNALIALGNARDRRAVGRIAHMLAADQRPEIRAAAAWALGQIGGAEAQVALNAAAAAETDPLVVQEINAAVAGFSSRQT